MHKWSSTPKEFLEIRVWLWSYWNGKKSLASDFSARHLASDTPKVPLKEVQRSLKDSIPRSWEVWSTVTIPSGFWGEKSHWTGWYLCSYGPVFSFTTHHLPHLFHLLCPIILPKHYRNTSFQRELGCEKYLSKLIRQNGKWVFRHHPGIKGKSSNKTGNIFLFCHTSLVCPESECEIQPRLPWMYYLKAVLQIADICAKRNKILLLLDCQGQRKQALETTATHSDMTFLAANSQQSYNISCDYFSSYDDSRT